MTILPGPGQQLMQAAMPNGTVQRFLFTPLATTATAASTTTTTTVSTTSAGRTWELSEYYVLTPQVAGLTKGARDQRLSLGE